MAAAQTRRTPHARRAAAARKPAQRHGDDDGGMGTHRPEAKGDVCGQACGAEGAGGHILTFIADAAGVEFTDLGEADIASMCCGGQGDRGQFGHGSGENCWAKE